MHERGRSESVDRVGVHEISGKGKKGIDGDPEPSNLPRRRMLAFLSKIMWLLFKIKGTLMLEALCRHSGDRIFA